MEEFATDVLEGLAVPCLGTIDSGGNLLMEDSESLPPHLWNVPENLPGKDAQAASQPMQAFSALSSVYYILHFCFSFMGPP